MSAVRRMTDTQPQPANETTTTRCLCSPQWAETEQEMIACDLCGYWMHYICAGIPSNTPPEVMASMKFECFVCDKSEDRKWVERVEADRLQMQARELKSRNTKSLGTREVLSTNNTLTGIVSFAGVPISSTGKRRRESTEASEEQVSKPKRRRPQTQHAQSLLNISSAVASPVSSTKGFPLVGEDEAAWRVEYTQITSSTWRTPYFALKDEGDPSVKPFVRLLVEREARKLLHSSKGKGRLSTELPRTQMQDGLEPYLLMAPHLPEPKTRNVKVVSLPTPSNAAFYAHLPIAVSRLELSTPKTHGLFASVDIPKNSVVMEHSGEMMEWKEYIRNPYNQYEGMGCLKGAVRLLVIQGVGKKRGVIQPIAERLVLDSRMKGSEARFARRGCYPNSLVKMLVVPQEEGRRTTEQPLLTPAIVALRDITKGEEIVVPWDWDDSHVIHVLPYILHPANRVPTVHHPHQPLMTPIRNVSLSALTIMLRKMSKVASHLGGAGGGCACTNKRDCAVAWMDWFGRCWEIYDVSSLGNGKTDQSGKNERELVDLVESLLDWGLGGKKKGRMVNLGSLLDKRRVEAKPREGWEEEEESDVEMDLDSMGAPAKAISLLPSPGGGQEPEPPPPPLLTVPITQSTSSVKRTTHSPAKPPDSLPTPSSLPAVEDQLSITTSKNVSDPVLHALVKATATVSTSQIGTEVDTGSQRQQSSSPLLSQKTSPRLGSMETLNQSVPAPAALPPAQAEQVDVETDSELSDVPTPEGESEEGEIVIHVAAGTRKKELLSVDVNRSESATNQTPFLKETKSEHPISNEADGREPTVLTNQILNSSTTHTQQTDVETKTDVDVPIISGEPKVVEEVVEEKRGKRMMSMKEYSKRKADGSLTTPTTSKAEIVAVRPSLSDGAATIDLPAPSSILVANGPEELFCMSSTTGNTPSLQKTSPPLPVSTQMSPTSVIVSPSPDRPHHSLFNLVPKLQAPFVRTDALVYSVPDPGSDDVHPSSADRPSRLDAPLPSAAPNSAAKLVSSDPSIINGDPGASVRGTDPDSALPLTPLPGHEPKGSSSEGTEQAIISVASATPAATVPAEPPRKKMSFAAYRDRLKQASGLQSGDILTNPIKGSPTPSISSLPLVPPAKLSPPRKLTAYDELTGMSLASGPLSPPSQKAVLPTVSDLTSPTQSPRKLESLFGSAPPTQPRRLLDDAGRISFGRTHIPSRPSFHNSLPIKPSDASLPRKTLQFPSPKPSADSLPNSPSVNPAKSLNSDMGNLPKAPRNFSPSQPRFARGAAPPLGPRGWDPDLPRAPRAIREQTSPPPGPSRLTGVPTGPREDRERDRDRDFDSRGRFDGVPRGPAGYRAGLSWRGRGRGR